MDGKRVIIGQMAWGVADDDADTVRKQIESAMENGTVAALPLIDSTGRAMTVYLNGKLTATVVVDFDMSARPSEISDMTARPSEISDMVARPSEISDMTARPSEISDMVARPSEIS